MRPTIFILFALFAVSWASIVRGQDYSKPMNSAAFIYGQMNEVTGFLWECADYDKQNAATYLNLFDQYIQKNKDLAARVVTIMRTETDRSGQSIKNLSKMLFDGKRIVAERAERMRREDPKRFLDNCRAQREVHKRSLAADKPFHDAYPVQMRVIDEWK